MIRKLFKNAYIVTPSDPGKPLAGKDQGSIRRFERGALLCRDGIIEAVGPQDGIVATPPAHDLNVEVDCGGRCLIPGFVDPHTHMCFAERREAEFAQRIEGMEYLDILRRGGGILSSVRAVRAASEDKLFSVARHHVLAALESGTTTLEIKSGYGLNTHTELKMLRVIERLGRETPLDVVPTFLGAHAVPQEYAQAPDDYVDIVIKEMIPAVSAQGIARFCDVFCEKGVFTLEQSRRILSRAREAGMGLKIHADEVHDLGGAGLAAELGAASAEHLLAANEENLAAMADKGVIAVLLPATAYSLRKKYAPARKMVDLGLPVALATDCNPGSSYTESMPFVFGLAVLNMNLAVNEALVATTLNAAYAVGMAEEVGSLEKGKKADFLLLDGESPAILAYHAGVSPVREVYKCGEMVFAR
jgi:imidazolonepropionase